MSGTTRFILAGVTALMLTPLGAIHAADTDRVLSSVDAVPASQQVEANHVAEIPLVSQKAYQNPFLTVELNAIVTQPDGKPLCVPAFWTGGNRWCFRYSSPKPGQAHGGPNAPIKPTRNSTASQEDRGRRLCGQQSLVPPRPHPCGQGPAAFRTRRRHAVLLAGRYLVEGTVPTADLGRVPGTDGRPPGQGFQRGPDRLRRLSDEGLFESRWENEGGKPYLARDFSVVNPAYFEYTDRRIKHLVEAGLVPAIVGGWGRGDCDGMRMPVSRASSGIGGT